MNVPEEFGLLVRQLNLTTLPSPFNEQVWISEAVAALSADQRARIHVYLEQLLSENVPPEVLQRVWEMGRPDFIVPDKDVRKFFTLIDEQL